MKFEFDLRVGDRVIHITDEAATQAEFFQKMAFYDTIPVAGPDGEAELKFSYRTPKGYEYYSIECRDAGKEFKFGQLKEARGVMPKGSFFPKDWEPILHGAEHYEEAEPHQDLPAEPGVSAKTQTARQPSQSSKQDPVADVKASDSVDLVARAKKLVDDGRVVRLKNGTYSIKVNDKVTYEVWRNDRGRVVCQCERFTKGIKYDSAYRCEHILAVKEIVNPASAAV